MLRKWKVGVWQKLGILTFTLYIVFLWTAPAVASPVAIFPFQKLSRSRNDADLAFSHLLAERLEKSGSEIIGLKAVIAYMAVNRIRSVGHLPTYNILRVRSDLGAPFLLLGTVTQSKTKPELSLGVSLQLVRTNDARIVWTYVNSLGSDDERRPLEIGEPQTVAALRTLLVDDILDHWPWQMVKAAQPSGSIDIESSVLWPRYVKPGEEVHSRVSLRNVWNAGQAPRVFFKVDDQLYPATVSKDGNTYDGTWVAGKKNGSAKVNLLFSWPSYGRTEIALIGKYVIDGTSPLFELNLGGVKMLNGIPVFRGDLEIIPRMIVRTAMSRWRLTFSTNRRRGKVLVGELNGNGNLPEKFVWPARNTHGSNQDGIYEVMLEAWDKAGNYGSASKKVLLMRSIPQVQLKTVLRGDDLVVNLQRNSSVPVAFWRFQIWTEDGNVLSHSEGQDLPVKIQVKVPGANKDQKLEGTMFVQDMMGNQINRTIKNLLPSLVKKKPVKESKTVSQKWVNEF